MAWEQVDLLLGLVVAARPGKCFDPLVGLQVVQVLGQADILRSAALELALELAYLTTRAGSLRPRNREPADIESHAEKDAQAPTERSPSEAARAVV